MCYKDPLQYSDQYLFLILSLPFIHLSLISNTYKYRFWKYIHLMLISNVPILRICEVQGGGLCVKIALVFYWHPDPPHSNYGPIHAWEGGDIHISEAISSNFSLKNFSLFKFWCNDDPYRFQKLHDQSIHPVQLVLLYLSTLLDSWLMHCDTHMHEYSPVSTLSSFATPERLDSST